MSIKSKFLSSLAAGLLLTGSALAQTGPVRATHVTPTQVVQQFLAARAAHNYTLAYSLLTAATRQQVPFAQFVRKMNFSDFAARVSPTTLAFHAMFMDLHGDVGYRFTVTGSDPHDAHSVLVGALPPHGATPAGFPLKIVTSADEASGGTPRIDVFASFPKITTVDAASAREQARRTTSLSNLRRIGLAALQYAADHSEYFPHADRWVDELLPYTKTARIFWDPSVPQGQYNYAFNRNLSALPFVKVISPATLVMIFESTKGVKNASDTGQSAPRPGRHLGGTDYAFADGHVKWRPDGTRLSYRPGVK